MEVKGLINKSCVIPGRLDGKVAIVTGCNTGIGLQTAGEIARRGGHVIMACRNMEKAEQARKTILSQYGDGNPDSVKTRIADASVIPSLSPVTESQLILEQLNLSSLKSVREFAARINEKYQKIDLLINNAGLAIDKYTKTEEGFEWDIGVNHLGPFLLTELLLPVIKNAAPSRIINVSSLVHYRGQLYKPDLDITEKGFDLMPAYRQSKLANVMHARSLSKRLEADNVIAVSLHPGIVDTEFFRYFTSSAWKIALPFVKMVTITPWQGAQTTMYTVLKKDLTPGGYYSNCALKVPSQLALDDAECEWLWKRSRELVGLDQPQSAQE